MFTFHYFTIYHFHRSVFVLCRCAYLQIRYDVIQIIIQKKSFEEKEREYEIVTHFVGCVTPFFHVIFKWFDSRTFSKPKKTFKSGYNGLSLCWPELCIFFLFVKVCNGLKNDIQFHRQKNRKKWHPKCEDIMLFLIRKGTKQVQIVFLLNHHLLFNLKFYVIGLQNNKPRDGDGDFFVPNEHERCSWAWIEWHGVVLNR